MIPANMWDEKAALGIQDKSAEDQVIQRIQGKLEIKHTYTSMESSSWMKPRYSLIILLDAREKTVSPSAVKKYAG